MSVGTIVFAYALGGSSGPFIAGMIFDNTGNYQWAFLLCTILAFFAIFIAISLKQVKYIV
jgi:cyanate permease